MLKKKSTAGRGENCFKLEYKKKYIFAAICGKKLKPFTYHTTYFYHLLYRLNDYKL